MIWSQEQVWVGSVNPAQELARQPEVRRLRERGYAFAGPQLTTVNNRLTARNQTPTDPATADLADVAGVLGRGTLPPVQRPDTPGPSP